MSLVKLAIAVILVGKKQFEDSN